MKKLYLASTLFLFAGVACGGADESSAKGKNPAVTQEAEDWIREKLFGQREDSDPCHVACVDKLLEDRMLMALYNCQYICRDSDGNPGLDVKCETGCMQRLTYSHPEASKKVGATTQAFGKCLGACE